MFIFFSCLVGEKTGFEVVPCDLGHNVNIYQQYSREAFYQEWCKNRRLVAMTTWHF